MAGKRAVGAMAPIAAGQKSGLTAFSRAELFQRFLPCRLEHSGNVGAVDLERAGQVGLKSVLAFLSGFGPVLLPGPDHVGIPFSGIRARWSASALALARRLLGRLDGQLFCSWRRGHSNGE